MSEEKDDRSLSYDEAVALLPDRETIHTQANPRAGMFIGADWQRAEVFALLRENEFQRAGPIATRMGHGVVVFRENGPLFLETRP